MKISIITASYNYENLISKAIESVINQTYTDWELIIVDDGSNDNSIFLIKKYCEKYPDKIFLYTHENNKNKGLKDTIKLGLNKTKCQYITFLESDDYWENNYLEEKLIILEKYPDIKFIFNDVKLFGDEKSISKLNEHFNTAKKILLKTSWPRNIFPHFVRINLVSTFSCAFVEKHTLLKCDLNTPIDALLDLWIWTQIAYSNNFFYIDKKLTNWMIHPKSYLKTSEDVSNTEKQRLFLKEIFKTIKKSPNHNINNVWKLYLLQIFTTPRIEKIFRGMIKKILALM
jgi:glycosyltransferase involved in cell wall biosynthesis